MHMVKSFNQVWPDIYVYIRKCQSTNTIPYILYYLYVLNIIDGINQHFDSNHVKMVDSSNFV